MKLLPVLMAVCAVALANLHTLETEDRSEWLLSLVKSAGKITDDKFRANREYKFFYDGQLTSGIPTSSQLTAGTRIQSLVTLVFTDESRVLLKLSNTRFGKLNGEVPSTLRLLPFESFEVVELDSMMRQKLEMTVQFRYSNGLISNIEFDGEEQTWSANIKRGVLNLIQINLSKDNLVDREIIDSEIENLNIELGTTRSFKTIEKTLEGECEVLYTVVPKRSSEKWSFLESNEIESLSPRFYTVIKSINFEKCNRRPEVTYNHRFQQICPSCEGRLNKEERSLVSSSVISMRVECPESTTSSCLIRKSTAESDYSFVLFGEESNIISTKVRQTLELVQSSSIETEVRVPSNKRTSDSQMVYSLDWDVMKEEFFVDGEESFDEKTPFSKLHDKSEFVMSVLVKLVHHTRESVSEQAPREFARLVKLIRMLKKDELKEIHSRFYLTHPESFTKEEHLKVKDFLLDSYSLAGTKNCVELLVSSINKNEMSTTKASMVIRKLMDVRVLSKDMILLVESICSSGKCDRSPQLEQAVMLTVGSMMRTLCHDKRQDKLAISSKMTMVELRELRCPKEIRDRFVNSVISKFESTSTQWKKVLCLKTLSNCGLKEIIRPLTKIIRDTKESPVLRVESIMALKHLVDQTPETIIKILLPVYLNRREHPSVRIASVFEIMNTLPDKIVLDQITRSLYTERNPSVATFTYTLFDTLSRSLNTCTKEMSDNIKLSMRPLRSLSFDKFINKSRFVRMLESHSRMSNFGVSMDYTNIKSGSILPWMMSKTLNLKFAGLWSPKFTTVSISQLGLSRVMNQLLRSYSHNMQSSLSDLMSGKPWPSPKFHSELKEMSRKLNIEPSSESEFEPFGMIDLKFKNEEFAFLPFSKDIIPSELITMVEQGQLTMDKVVRVLQQYLKSDMQSSFSFHTGSFVHQQSRKIPTSLGLPIRVSFKVPTIMQVTGTVKAEFDTTSPLKKVKLSVKDLKPSVVSTMVTKVECWSPIFNSGVKVIAQVKAFAPFEGSISMDLTKSPSKYEVIVSPITRKAKEIFRLQSRPVTFTRVWPKSISKWEEPEERTIHRMESDRVHEHDVIYGENKFGIKFESVAKWHKSLTYSHKTSPFSLLSGPNFYSLTSSAGHEMPKEFIMTITGNLFDHQSTRTISSNFDTFFNSNSASKEKSLDISLSSESSEETSFESKEYNKIYTRSNPVSNELIVRLSTRGSSIKREVDLTTSCLCDETMKSCKCKLDIERTPIPTEETHSWKLESEFEVVYPETPLRVSELSSSKRVLSRIQSKWGPKDSMTKKFNVKIVAEQSRLIKEIREMSLYSRMYKNKSHRTSHRSFFSPVAQYQQTMKYGHLDEIKFDFDYQLSNSQEEFLNSMFSSLKNSYFEKTITSQITARKTKSGRVVAKLNIDPINHQFLNLTVQTPLEQTSIIDMPMFMSWPSWMNLRKVSSPSRSSYQWISSLFRSSMPVCQIRTDRLMTFNKVERSIPTSTCYSVLAKDCSEKSKFSILLKKQSPTTELKTLKIVSENIKLVIKSFESEPLECKVNDVISPCSEIDVETIHGGHVALSCRQHSTEMIECHLPEAGVKVYFDGYSTDVKVSEVYSSSVCGLCGSKRMRLEELPMLEDISERREEQRVTRDLLERYLLKEDNEQCQHEFTSQPSSFFSLIDRDNERFSTERRYSSEIEVPENMESPIRTHRSVVRPVRKTRVIEQGSEICFSKTPVKTCPRNTYSISKSEQKERVVFTCMPRHSRQARLFEERIVRDKVLSDLESEISSFTESIWVPIKCKHYNY